VGDNYSKRFWFALQVRTNQERTVDELLISKGYETYLPSISEARAYNGRAKLFRVAAFKGYLFCKLDLAERLRVLITPYVYQIVGRGKCPEPVPEGELNILKDLEARDVPLERCPFPNSGERVRIERGPLLGIVGVLQESRNSSRLIVSINLLQRSVCAEVRREDVILLDPVRPQYRAATTGC
jgi:transcription antitermination factor NusG